MIKDIIKTLKINHYIKNIVVFIPLVFSMNVGNISLCAKEIVTFLAFCLISSVVYIMNDLIDIEKDSLHPIKKLRPIASGKISKQVAIILLVFLLFVSFFLAISINKLTVLVILSYLVLNFFYSLVLKNIPIVDAFCIAMGFILRVVAGCFAICVTPSPLVILLTFFSSLFFTFAKRKLELQVAIDTPRKSIKDFNIDLTNQFILANAILSIAFYFTYVLDKTTIAKAGSEHLYLTVIPFSLIVFRLLFLVQKEVQVDDPMHFIEKDKTIKCMAVLYLFVLYLVLVFIK